MSRGSDRDGSLERLLRTSLDQEPGAVTPSCVDAERLAAWSDGSLTPGERASIEAHISSCPRCLAMLAAFADTAPPAVAETPFWRRLPARWLVPIATGAAALLIWAVVPGRPPEPAFAPATQVARDERSASAPVPQRSDAPATNETREFAAPQAQPAPDSPAPAEPAQSPAQPATATGRQRQAQAEQTRSVSEEPAARSVDSLTAAGQRAASESAMSDRMAAPAPSPSATASTNARALPATPPAVPQAALQRAEAAAIDIRSPDPSFRWRVRSTIAERTTNGGASWQPITLPAPAAVTGGTSPSPTVCWLIGTNGTVLRTADGVSFAAVNIPGAGALASIQAPDASRATVTGTDGRVYSTMDGGKSWTR